MKLDQSYFQTDDVLSLARDLLGKYVFTLIDGQLAGGQISEVEAYKGMGDKACHAYGGRRTARNEMMYHDGGVAYIFLCYGMHHMLNFVSNRAEIPDAVLVRSIIPTHGEELMLQRLGKSRATQDMTNGPGKVAKALGITMQDNGCALNSDRLWLEDRSHRIPAEEIEITARIGVDYAKEDAGLPYRFVWKV